MSRAGKASARWRALDRGDADREGAAVGSPPPGLQPRTVASEPPRTRRERLTTGLKWRGHRTAVGARNRGSDARSASAGPPERQPKAQSANLAFRWMAVGSVQALSSASPALLPVVCRRDYFPRRAGVWGRRRSRSGNSARPLRSPASSPSTRTPRRMSRAPHYLFVGTPWEMPCSRPCRGATVQKDGFDGPPSADPGDR
jgi:hypothetical protein